jgi:hypothetical protein
MDQIRYYYRSEKLTAPAFRLEYIYTYTNEPNLMRSFLIDTTAFRSMCEQPSSPGVYMSNSIRDVLTKDSTMAIDFAEALVGLHKSGMHDPRHGVDCA